MMLAAENLFLDTQFAAIIISCRATPGAIAHARGAAFRLVERPLRARQGLRLAQHLEAHRAGQRRHFDQADLDAVGKLISLAGALAEQRARRFVEDIVIAVRALTPG